MESYLSFGVWLLSLNIIFNVHPYCTYRNFLPFFGWIIFHCMIINILFIHPSIDRQLDCFHLLVIMNHPAVNIGQQRSVWVPVFNFLWYIPRSRIAGLYGNSTFNSLRTHQTVFHSCNTILHPTSDADTTCSNFSISSPTLVSFHFCLL